MPLSYIYVYKKKAYRSSYFWRIAGLCSPYPILRAARSSTAAGLQLLAANTVLECSCKNIKQNKK